MVFNALISGVVGILRGRGFGLRTLIVEQFEGFDFTWIPRLGFRV